MNFFEHLRLQRVHLGNFFLPSLFLPLPFSINFQSVLCLFELASAFPFLFSLITSLCVFLLSIAHALDFSLYILLLGQNHILLIGRR
jgi:hypothetical protein